MTSQCQSSNVEVRGVPESCAQTKSNRPALTSFLTSVLLTISVGFAAPAMSANSGPAEGSKIITVEANSAGSVVTLGGNVVAYREVTLSAQVAGRVEVISGTEGDAFKAKDILIAIDDDDLLAKRRAAVAQYNNAQAAITNARVQYDRELWSPQSRSLSRSGGMGMPSMMDQMFTQPMSQMMPGTYGGDRGVDRAADIHGYGTQVTQAQNELLAAKSVIEEIDAELRDARSFAPFDGVIISKFVEEGDTVQPGQAMMVYADLTYLQVEVDVPVRLVAGLKKGMQVPVKIDVGNIRADARVAQIFPTADAMRHTVKVKFDLPTDVKGGPGMYAEVMVPDTEASGEAVPVIPDSAVLWRGSLPAVYVATKNDRTELRLIRVGDYVNADHVAVLSGLKIGERIYVAPPKNASKGWSKRAAE